MRLPRFPSRDASRRPLRAQADKRSSRLVGRPRRRAMPGQLISLTGLLRRPVRDPAGAQAGRLVDVTVRWLSGEAYPPVTGVVVRVGQTLAFVEIGSVDLSQKEVRLRTSRLMVDAPIRAEGDVALAGDVLDRQLVDTAGVQVVRAADVYLAATDAGLRLAGVDVGMRALLRRLPLRRQLSRPSPDRVIPWSELQAFAPRAIAGQSSTADGAAAPAGAAGNVGGSVRIAVAASDLHSLRQADVADVLAELGRAQQSQLVAVADPATAAAALSTLSPAARSAVLAGLRPDQRARVEPLLPKETDR